MTFPTDTIRLEAARKIFTGTVIEIHKIGDRTAYYSATFNEKTLQHTSLTGLCGLLWAKAVKR